MINDHKNRREWKIQLTMSFSFTSSKYSDEIRNLHIKSNNTEIMIDNETDDIIVSKRFRRTNERKRI